MSFDSRILLVQLTSWRSEQLIGQRSRLDQIMFGDSSWIQQRVGHLISSHSGILSNLLGLESDGLSSTSSVSRVATNDGHVLCLGWFLEVSDDVLVHQSLCIVRVLVRLNRIYVLKTVSAVEELGDISADVGLETERATWMFAHERTQVENHVIQKTELFALSDSGIEVVDTYHVVLVLDDVWLLILDSILVVQLRSDDNGSEQGDLPDFEWEV